MDFTPGIFNISIPQRPNNQVNTTLSKQLALYIIIYSPIQMAADLIENYEGHPAFKFIVDVPVDWEKSKTIDAAIGDYVIITRKDKHSDDWYLGVITDEKSREFSIKLDFLEKSKKYEAQIYGDNEKSDYKANPMEYQITKQVVGSDDSLILKLAVGGGTAIRFKQLD